MQNYRILVRGNQHYIAPKVGKTWLMNERYDIRKALEAQGYFVKIVSAARLSLSETSNSPRIEDAAVYIEKV